MPPLRVNRHSFGAGQLRKTPAASHLIFAIPFIVSMIVFEEQRKIANITADPLSHILFPPFSDVGLPPMTALVEKGSTLTALLNTQSTAWILCRLRWMLV